MHVELYRHPCTVTWNKRLRESGQFSTSIATFFPIFHAYRSQNTVQFDDYLTFNHRLATRDPIFHFKIFLEQKETRDTNSVTSLFRSKIV